MIFGLVTRIDLLNFIKKNGEAEERDNDDDVFRTSNGSSTSLSNKMEALKMTTAMGHGDAASHVPLANGIVNGHVHGENAYR